MPNTFEDQKPIPELKLDPPVQYIDILVTEIEKVLLLYDRIEIWRSSDNVTYTEITADDDYPAFVRGTSSGPFNVSGKLYQYQRTILRPLVLLSEELIL